MEQLSRSWKKYPTIWTWALGATTMWSVWLLLCLRRWSDINTLISCWRLTCDSGGLDDIKQCVISIWMEAESTAGLDLTYGGGCMALLQHLSTGLQDHRGPCWLWPVIMTDLMASEWKICWVNDWYRQYFTSGNEKQSDERTGPGGASPNLMVDLWSELHPLLWPLGAAKNNQNPFVCACENKISASWWYQKPKHKIWKVVYFIYFQTYGSLVCVSFFGDLPNPTCVTQWEETLLVVLTQTGSLACMLCELNSAICQTTWTKTVSG